GVLKDDLDVAAQDAKIVGLERADIFAVEMDFARTRFDQAKHAAAGGRLAAAGFTDQPKRFAAVDVEIDAVDRMNAGDLTAEQPALERKFLGQFCDFEQRLAH